MKIYVSIHRSENGLCARVTSSTEISMDTFDIQWKAYTRKSKFFTNYKVLDKEPYHGIHHLQLWYERILRSQFENSADRSDKILLIHWTVDIGNREDFLVDNFIVPFHAIVKTPIMEHWYTHANIGNHMVQVYIRQSRRIPLFDENKVIQPYYHTKFDCSYLNQCSIYKNCNKKKVLIPHAIVAECEKLAEEVF